MALYFHHLSMPFQEKRAGGAQADECVIPGGMNAQDGLKAPVWECPPGKMKAQRAKVVPHMRA